MRTILGIFALGCAAGAAWQYMRRPLRGQQRACPPDHVGHYDMDGVSFDRQEGQVIVSGDDTRPVRDPLAV